VAVALRDLVLRFTADPAWIPDVANELTDAIHRELPQLRADDELRRATYASTESVVALFVEHLRLNIPPADAEPPPAAVEFARELVQRGLPLDALLRSYHVGHATFFRRWSGEVHAVLRDPADVASAVEQAAAATFAFVQALDRGVVRRWADERDRWVRGAAAMRAELVRTLVAGEPVDAVRAGRRLAYDLSARHVGFLVWPASADPDPDPGALERAAGSVADAIGGPARLLVPLRARLLAGWVTVGSGPSSGGALRASSDVIAALGSPRRGVPGFRRTHAEAMDARRVARLEHRRPGAVVRYESIAVAALASADLEHARRFVADQLGTLSHGDDEARRLSATLRAYLEEGASPRRTARRLGVHENTVSNRLATIEERLGHPVRERVTELLVALRLAGIAGAEPADARRARPAAGDGDPDRSPRARLGDL